MDKIRTKQVWQAIGLPTPRYARLVPSQSGRGDDLGAAIKSVGLPVVVKPSHEGSSVGITRVYKESDLASAIELASRYDGELVIEELIEGGEFTVSVLHGQALPSIHIVPKGAFYDYHAKYVAEDTEYICPGLDGDAERTMRELAMRAFESSGASGWGRVDIMQDRDGRNYLLEVNTTPGMTSHSLVPKAAKALGIDFETLCWRILETSFEKEAGFGIRDSGSSAASPIPNPQSRLFDGGAA
jgi:D-alanine-D-alanine ligase